MTPKFSVKESKNGLTFDIQVTPRASRAEIVGVQDDALKVKVTALPVEGAANEACIKLLAKELGLKKKSNGNICRRQITPEDGRGERYNQSEAGAENRSHFEGINEISKQIPGC